MKRLIIAFLMMGLVLMAGCARNFHEFDPEAQKKAEDAAEKEKQKDKAVKEAVQNKIEGCDLLDDEDYKKTTCLADGAIDLREKYKSRSKNIVYQLCDQAGDPDYCYYYTAFMTKTSAYCEQIEDKDACKVMSDRYYCQSLVNRRECLVNKAFLMRYLDIEESKRICRNLPSATHYDDTNLTCKNIDFSEAEYDNDLLSDRFFLMYWVSSFLGLETDYITVPR